jgi:hypothetical protein
VTIDGHERLALLLDRAHVQVSWAIDCPRCLALVIQYFEVRKFLRMIVLFHIIFCALKNLFNVVLVQDDKESIEQTEEYEIISHEGKPKLNRP